nr:unnamed protein product [Callosobruchus analis]
MRKGFPDFLQLLVHYASFHFLPVFPLGINEQKKNFSLVELFFKETEFLAKCDLCKETVSYKTSTTNLKKHIERKHPLVRLQHFEDSRFKTCAEQNDISKPCTSSSELGLDTGPKPDSNESYKHEPSQAKLPFIPKSTNIHTKKKFDSCLMELFAKDMQPFSIVHDQGFKNFVQLLNPSYQLPSRKYISNTLLPALYEEKYNCVQKLVSDIQSATLTTDCWTSMNTESFIAVTVHFISEDLQAKSVLLECCSFPKAHTSVNLVTELNRIVTLWELESKILLAVKNNAANIKRAVKEDLSWKHFGCYAHTINLVVQDGLKLVSPVLTKVRALVAHFKRSTTTSGKLMDIQRQAGKEPKKLLQDVEARWNSTFYMLDRILDMEEVRTVMALLNVNNLPVVLVEGWAFLRQLRKCLKPMEEITKL